MGPRGLARALADWREDGVALYEALGGAVAGLISQGQLEPGAALPPERRLADELGVSRNTVVGAYTWLRERDYVSTRHGSGTTVRDVRSETYSIPPPLAANGIFDGFLAPNPDAIDFRAAYWVGAEGLPPAALDLSRGRDAVEAVGGHGYHPYGLPVLRDAIAQRLGTQGLPTTTDEVLVTTGCQQALALLTAAWVGPSDRVAVEALTYPGILDLVRAARGELVPVRLGDHGPDTGALTAIANGPPVRFAYLVLSGHNPTGTVAPEHVRGAIANLVRGGLVVVDDRTLSDLIPEGPAPPPLAAYVDDDAEGLVVTVGSFSKSFWGGLRVGWVRAPAGLIAQLGQLKTLHDIGSGVLDQITALRLLGDADTAVAARNRQAVARRDLLLRLLREQLPDWEPNRPRAGLCCWVRLPGVSSLDFAAFATRYGVEVAPGTISSADGGHHDHLRLPFGRPTHVIEEAVTRLAGAWEVYADRRRSRDRIGVVV